MKYMTITYLCAINLKIKIFTKCSDNFYQVWEKWPSVSFSFISALIRLLNILFLVFLLLWHDSVFYDTFLTRFGLFNSKEFQLL